MKTNFLSFWSEWNEGRSQVSGSSLWNPDLRASFGHPVNDVAGREALETGVFGVLRRALPDVSRDTAIAMEGEFKGGSWVACQGHYVGTLEGSLFGIPKTSRVASIRFGEFCRFENGAVVEMYCILDWLDLMRQAGVYPLMPPLGATAAWPAPRTQDGIVASVSPEESRKSLELVEAMIAGLMQYDGASLESMDMPRFWSRRMMWFGPAGIGTARGLKGFQDHHQRSFLAAFPDRVGGNHKCRIGEGAYVASTGWPSIKATHSGSGFLGLPTTGKKITMRVMDFWRREGLHLDENWVFIDLPELMLQMGIDVFQEMRGRSQGCLE